MSAMNGDLAKIDIDTIPSVVARSALVANDILLLFLLE